MRSALFGVIESLEVMEEIFNQGLINNMEARSTCRLFLCIYQFIYLADFKKMHSKYS